MKILKKSILFLTAGLLVGTLSGCFKKKEDSTTKDPLVIPTVEVESLNVNLPERPVRNSGPIRSDESYEYIDLYELSDFHGAVEYEPSHESGTYIGLSKLASYFEQKRNDNKGGTLLLSSGDMFQGSADSNLTRGYLVNYCMQYMGFDAMALGNHEFDWTDTWIKKNAELQYNTSTIPYLGANITKNGQMPEFLKKSTVVSRGDYKIGVIGVIGNKLENTILKSCIKDYEFSTYKDIVDTEAARLRSAEHCDAVVLLAHEAADEIELVSGVDAIFGGHAHENKIATINATIPSLATLNYGQSVAHIALKFNKNTKAFVDANDYEIVEMSSVGASLQDDSNVKNIMNQFAPSINQIKNLKLGTCDAKLAHNKALKNICTTTLFNDAVKAADQVDEIDSSKIVMSLHNVNGGIRDDIPAGDITYGNVYRSFPFDNEIILLKLSGSEVLGSIDIIKSLGLGLYKTFENRSYFSSSEYYYFATTDFLALSEKYLGKIKHFTDEDLIRTGYVVRDEVAKRIYELDNISNSEWAAEKSCYTIPMTF